MQGWNAAWKEWNDSTAAGGSTTRADPRCANYGRSTQDAGPHAANHGRVPEARAVTYTEQAASRAKGNAAYASGGEGRI